MNHVCEIWRDVTRWRCWTAERVSVREKRITIHTAKGLELFIVNCQKARNLKYKQVKKLMERLKELMNSKDNANEIQLKLVEFMKLCEELKENHASLTNLQLLKKKWKRKSSGCKKRCIYLMDLYKMQMCGYLRVDRQSHTLLWEVPYNKVSAQMTSDLMTVFQRHHTLSQNTKLVHHIHHPHPLLELKLRQKVWS